MTSTSLQLVRPASARFEGLAIFVACAIVLGILFSYVRARGVEPTREPLQEWQVSAFDTLTGADQAIYNALFTAKDDVPYIYDDINLMTPPGAKFRWPSLQDFQAFLLPPFFRDRSWEQNGSMQWTLFEPVAEGEMQGSIMYLGTDGKVPGQGSFLLVIGHVHAGFQNNNAMAIWWNRENHVTMPRSGFRDGLILQGWKEVVPHSGASEIRRLYGDKAAEPASEADQEQAEQAIEGVFGGE